MSSGTKIGSEAVSDSVSVVVVSGCAVVVDSSVVVVVDISGSLSGSCSDASLEQDVATNKAAKQRRNFFGFIHSIPCVTGSKYPLKIQVALLLLQLLLKNLYRLTSGADNGHGDVQGSPRPLLFLD